MLKSLPATDRDEMKKTLLIPPFLYIVITR